ncbi:uncharacterized protein A4U43_C04F17540 [Asparagus officinalis]|uniref:Terpene synthase N-terminal domain-containing protein n=2 Tax=Asparagus officinalis TaxID=4686 RepID=A0A5P1F272_ASPOF|nr:uncharacterized protein A4U43_C04F17540 [Asparagus officinalis]
MEELKEEAAALLSINKKDIGTTLSLIDEIQRLGLEYHFKEEINESLRHVLAEVEEIDDTHSVALSFRLLRQQGYYVSSNVFKKLKDKGGKFKEELSRDAKGLLFLYEASWLGTREDEILDEAMDFAKVHMERLLVHDKDGVLAAQIERALEMPYHRCMRRLEARHYFTMHKDEKERRHVFFELAKLDFNLLQSMHQTEIKAISTWWRELGLIKKLSFARDRVVECYFWILGVHFEPQFSEGRILLTKIIALTSVMDDIFDAYGTLEELHQFNDAIQRWDVQDVSKMPEYMIIYLHSFMSLIREIEEELCRKGMLHHKYYLAESIKALVGAYFKEAKWANKGYMPTLEEYLNISVMSSGYPMLICVALIVMEQEVTAAVLDLVLSVPKAVEASALISRLRDDLVSTKMEQERKHVASSVQCYMNDHGVTEQVARLKLSTMVANAWKDLNQGCLQYSCPSQRNLNMLALNFVRMAEVIYKHEDGYTNPSGEMKQNIGLLLLHSVHG